MTVPGAGPGAGPKDMLAALRERRIQGRKARLRAAASLFEGVFYEEMFKAMRETVPEGGVVSGGTGEDIFTGLLDQHVAEAAASQNRRGIGGALYRYLTRADR